MAAPVSARPLPPQYPNNSAPMVLVKGQVELRDSAGRPVSGEVTLDGMLTIAWRYVFSLFAQKSKSINSGFSQTIDAAYNQAQVQALSDQVAAISRQLGLS